MPISSQVLKTIHFTQLKGLKNVEIDFQGNQLTAIMGRNGVGKSTVIHALACIHKPPSSPTGLANYRFSEFFTPTSHSIWTGSRFEVTQDFRDAATVNTDYRTVFTKQQDRWAPKYDTRIERYLSYIGIRTAVPQIEKETKKSRIQFNNNTGVYANANTVMQLAGRIMKRQYAGLNLLTAAGKAYLGVQLDGVDYSSLSMGAGEQRIFYILNEVVKAPNNALILIDEIDVLLHHDALQELLEIINRIAVQKRLQVIFTSHSHSILDNSFINFRHLFQTPTSTLCFNETKPDALQRLTGESQRPLEIFVEDFVAHAIVKKVASQVGMSKYLSIKKFGVAANCFTTVAGAILNQLDNLDNMLFVLDGDVFRSESEKEREAKRALLGDDPIAVQRRVEALSKITEFVLPPGQKPEPYYHSLICRLNNAALSAEQIEIVETARQVQHVQDPHEFFSEIYILMDWEPAVGLSKLIDLLSLTPEWNIITENIRSWLTAMTHQILEQPLAVPKTMTLAPGIPTAPDAAAANLTVTS